MRAGGTPATWLQGRDSNPRFPAYEAGEIGHFSTLRRWCAQSDSNRQASRFAAWCSIQLSYERTDERRRIPGILVAEAGFEPAAFGLWARRAAAAPLRDERRHLSGSRVSPSLARRWSRPSSAAGIRQCPCFQELKKSLNQSGSGRRQDRDCASAARCGSWGKGRTCARGL